MKIISLKSIFVCQNMGNFSFQFGYNHYNFGVQISKGRIRFLLIWYHIILDFNK